MVLTVAIVMTSSRVEKAMITSCGGDEDLLDGGQGNDTLDGEDDEDVLLGGQGKDIMMGRQFS